MMYFDIILYHRNLFVDTPRLVNLLNCLILMIENSLFQSQIISELHWKTDSKSNWTIQNRYYVDYSIMTVYDLKYVLVYDVTLSTLALLT